MRQPAKKTPAKKQKSAKRKAVSNKMSLQKASAESVLLRDLRELIASTRERVAQAVNSALVRLYWNVGQRIRQDILKEKRAEYGKEIVATVSQQLTKEFGQGFTKSNITRMCQLAEYFPDERIVATLSRQLIPESRSSPRPHSPSSPDTRVPELACLLSCLSLRWRLPSN